MLTVPFALVGALVGLWLFGNSLNLLSQIGIVIISGVAFSTVLSLFVVPASYALLAPRTRPPGHPIDWAGPRLHRGGRRE